MGDRMSDDGEHDDGFYEQEPIYDKGEDIRQFMNSQKRHREKNAKKKKKKKKSA